MGTLLPNFILSDAEDEFFFSSAIDDKFYLWKDDSLMEDFIEQEDDKNIFHLHINNQHKGFSSLEEIIIQDDGKLIKD
jgi:hypothetical protein